MESQETTNWELVRKSFENREAIYIEHGALRVRVFNLRADLAAAYFDADVEEIPTTGFDPSMFHARHPNAPRPLRWDIRGEIPRGSSRQIWVMGYGGWMLFFAPRVVQGIVELASQWPNDLDLRDRYDQVWKWLVRNELGRTRPAPPQA